jgi:hypothetical protein
VGQTVCACDPALEHQPSPPSSRRRATDRRWEDGQRRRKEAEARLADLAQREIDLRSYRAEVDKLRSRWKAWEGALQWDGGKDGELGRQVIKKLLSTSVSANPTEAGTWEWTTVGTFEGMLKGYVGTIRAALLASCQRRPSVGGLGGHFGAPHATNQTAGTPPSTSRVRSRCFAQPRRSSAVASTQLAVLGSTTARRRPSDPRSSGRRCARCTMAR